MIPEIMAFTQADLDKLDRAIADGRGAQSISFADQTITFRTVDDMLKLRSLMKRQVDSALTHRLAVVSKGTST